MGYGKLVLPSGKASVLAMLTGEYQHDTDTRGRLIVPSRFREELDRRFVVTRRVDDYLFGYPLSERSQLEAELQEMPLAKKDVRTFVRFFYPVVTGCEIDRRDRTDIPANLRTHASLEKGCIAIGVSNRIEIQSDERWHTFSDETEENLDELVEIVINLGFQE